MTDAPDAPPDFKAGFVAVLGRPNAGKSTLVNALLGSKLNAVSPKPQTTRHKILGILDGEKFQMCLVDTPGLLAKPGDELQKALRHTAKKAAHEDADVVLLLVEPEKPDPETIQELSGLCRGGAPVVLALNKIDVEERKKFHEDVLKAYTEALKPAAVVRVSALKKQGLDELKKELLARLPNQHPYYEQGHLSDRYERFFAAELIREKIFELFHEEIPHATAVLIEQYREKEGRPDQVMATLFVERDGQKGILIGKNGEMLEKLRSRSQAAIESFVGRQVDLELWIKVRHNWRKDPAALKEFGYLG